MVQEFYRAYHKAQDAYGDYQEKAAEWEKSYGEKPDDRSLHKKMQEYQQEKADRHTSQTTQKKDRGAR